jgi:DNA replication protein DnaC
VKATGSGSIAPCQFGLCDGSGFVFDEQTQVASDCHCRPARRREARMRRLESQIPKRYRAISFEHSEVIDIERRNGIQVRELRAYVRNLDANLDAGRGLWLCGGTGTGKTALAMIVSRTALDAGRSVAIYSLPRLLSVIRESIDSDGGLLGFLDLLATVDLLHLDDLGAEYRTDWTIEQLYSIINMRYQDQRAPTSSATAPSRGWRECARCCPSTAPTRAATASTPSPLRRSTSYRSRRGGLPEGRRALHWLRCRES